jgi:Fe-S cluster biogenesis protein NfuA
MSEHAAPEYEPAERDVRAAGERIERLLDSFSAAGPVARERAEELVRVVVELYGAGIERLLEIADGGGALTDETVAALAADELVAGLLVVHGLHPYGVVTRVEQALDGVRPYLASHGGDVELLGVDDGDGGAVVRLRLLGHCDGCVGSTATLQSAVDSAVRAAAPEVVRIDVAEPTAPAHPAPVAPLIPIESLTARIRS